MDKQREHDRLVSEISRSSRSSDPFAAAVRATRMPMLITDPNQPDNPIVFVNDAFSRLTGYSREEILYRNCRFLQGPETDQSKVAEIRSAIQRRVPVEVELLNHKKNGEIFFNRLLISPVFDEEGVLTYFFASQFDVTLERDLLVRVQRDRDALEAENARRADELRQLETRVQFILKAGRFGSWTLDLIDQRLVASEICKMNFGRKPSDPFSYEDLIATVYPEDRPRMKQAVASSIENNSEYEIEYRVVMPSGEIRWVEIRGQTFYRTDGTPLSMAGVSIDVTERKRGEEHRALLVAELNHRVKNSMATMQSIAHQTLRLASNLDEARSNLDARLSSLSAAHDILTRENWGGATIREVATGALAPFRAQAERFTMGGPNIRVSPRAALAYAMALHELATNALKYGALSNDVGRVIINWDVETRDGTERLVLRWEELNGPPVHAPSRSGFGSRMIERMLVSEIGGEARIDYRTHGVVCMIEAPTSGLQRFVKD